MAYSLPVVLWVVDLVVMLTCSNKIFIMIFLGKER